MNENQKDENQTQPSQIDKKPIFANIYLVYAAIVTGLFLFLVGMAWLAVQNGWIPGLSPR